MEGPSEVHGSCGVPLQALEAPGAPPLSPCPGPADLEDPLGEARLLRELLQVLGVGVVVNGKVRLHGPKLVVLEGGAHALCFLAARVGLVAVQVLRVVLVAAQRWGGDTQRRQVNLLTCPPTLPSPPLPYLPPKVSSFRTKPHAWSHHAEMKILSPFCRFIGEFEAHREPRAQGLSASKCRIQTQL